MPIFSILIVQFSEGIGKLHTSLRTREYTMYGRYVENQRYTKHDDYQAVFAISDSDRTNEKEKDICSRRNRSCTWLF